MSSLISELLSRGARRKLAQRMKRTAKKNAKKRERSAKRLASPEKLKSRAKKEARNVLIKKFTKGKDKSELSISQREKIEKRLKAPALKSKIDRLAKKGLKDVKAKDRARVKAKRASKKEDVDIEFDLVLSESNLKKQSDVQIIIAMDSAAKAKDKKAMVAIRKEMKKRGLIDETKDNVEKTKKKTSLKNKDEVVVHEAANFKKRTLLEVTKHQVINTINEHNKKDQ